MGTADGGRDVVGYVASNGDGGRSAVVDNCNHGVADFRVVNANACNVCYTERFTLNGQRLTIVRVSHVITVGFKRVSDTPLLHFQRLGSGADACQHHGNHDKELSHFTYFLVVVFPFLKI